MLQKPKCPIIALEEHYADDELVATYTGLDVNPVPAIGSTTAKRTAWRSAAIAVSPPTATKTLKTIRLGRMPARNAAAGSEPVA